MTRLLILLFTWLFLALGTANAVPARFIFDPVNIPRPVVAPSQGLGLKGSTWTGKYLTTTRTFILEADGTLTYVLVSKQTIRNYGNWRVEGKTLTFETRTKTMQFQGQIQNDNSIAGEFVTPRTGRRTPTILERTTLDNIK